VHRSSVQIAPILLWCVLILSGSLLLSALPREALAEKTQKAKPKKPPPKVTQPPKKTSGTSPKVDTKAFPRGTASPSEGETPKSAPAGGVSEELRGPTRIDFDDRLIQGQTNKSGAVYLFDRKETGIASMVRRRKSFKQLTVGTIYDR
jgi:hypothetical protein